jgi:hypothetical protein
VHRVSSALVVLLLLALPACGPGGPTAAPSSPSVSPSVSPTLTARDAIAAVVAASAAAPSHATERRQFGTNTLTITADYGTGMDRVRYVWDQPKQPAFVAVGGDFYFQTYPKVARPWLHLLRSKLGQASKLPALTNLVPAFTLLGGIVEAEATGPGAYTGRVNLQHLYDASTDPRARGYITDIMTDGATEMSFTLTVESGRVAKLRCKSGSVLVEATIGYGSDLTVGAPPSDQVRQATAQDYQDW